MEKYALDLCVVLLLFFHLHLLICRDNYDAVILCIECDNEYYMDYGLS